MCAPTPAQFVHVANQRICLPRRVEHDQRRLRLGHARLEVIVDQIQDVRLAGQRNGHETGGQHDGQFGEHGEQCDFGGAPAKATANDDTNDHFDRTNKNGWARRPVEYVNVVLDLVCLACTRESISHKAFESENKTWPLSCGLSWLALIGRIDGSRCLLSREYQCCR